MVVSPRCLERGLSSTPLHHQCEGRPPAFQASRATRATNSAVASAACLKGPRGARYSICGCIGHRAFPAPSDFWADGFLQNLGRTAPRDRGVLLDVIARSASDEAIHSFFMRRYGLLRGACHRARIRATRWLAMTVSELAIGAWVPAFAGTTMVSASGCAISATDSAAADQARWRRTHAYWRAGRRCRFQG